MLRNDPGIVVLSAAEVALAKALGLAYEDADKVRATAVYILARRGKLRTMPVIDPEALQEQYQRCLAASHRHAEMAECAACLVEASRRKVIALFEEAFPEFDPLAKMAPCKAIGTVPTDATDEGRPTGIPNPAVEQTSSEPGPGHDRTIPNPAVKRRPTSATASTSGKTPSFNTKIWQFSDASSKKTPTMGGAA